MHIKSLLVSLVFLLPLAGSSQEMEGTIRYLVVHNWAKKMTSLDYLSKQQREKMSYMWGKDSEWKMYANLYFTPVETKYEDSEEKAEPDDEGYSWRKEVYFIKRNFEKNTVYDVMQLLNKTYIIEDSLHAPAWKVMNDMKEVAGHICMNAFMEDTVRQQKIYVWFALDIPISGGPERLCGLPGMILEADVNDGALLLTADKIDLKKLTTEMDPPKKVKGKKITEAEYVALVKKHITEKREAEEPWFWGMRY